MLVAPPMGVVPIFVNVGAAALPALIAALASIVGLLLRPRELWRACRRRPARATAVVLAAAIAWFGGPALWKLAARAPGPASGDEIDWSQVAVEMLQRQQLTRQTLASATAARVGDVMFRQDSTRSGFCGGPSPRRLALLWTHSEENVMHLSSPVVAGKWVFGASCELDPPINYGSVFCLDIDTGKRRWLQEYPKDPKTGEEVELKGFFSSPAVTADGRFLIIGQGLHVDKNCDLLCFDAETGMLRWRIPTPLHLESSPVISGDMAVVGAGAIEGKDLKPVGDPGFVLAVRISDGAQLWRAAVNDPESSPAIAPDGTVYIGSGFNGSELVALRSEPDDSLKEKGQSRVLWRQKTPFPATGAVTLAGDVAIVGCGNGNYIFAAREPAGAVLAFDRKTGRPVWELPMPDSVLGAVAVRGDRAVCAVRNGEVVAIDLRTQRILWRSRAAGRTPILTGPAFTGELVYAVTKDGYLAVLDAADGSLVEKHYVNAESRPGELGLCISSPTVAAGRVFVGSETGGLRCYVGRAAE